MRGDSNTLNVRYEDLLQSPTRTVEGVIRFLDLTFTPEILAPDGTEAWSIEAGLKHKDKITQSIDPDNAFK